MSKHRKLISILIALQVVYVLSMPTAVGQSGGDLTSTSISASTHEAISQPGTSRLDGIARSRKHCRRGGCDGKWPVKAGCGRDSRSISGVYGSGALQGTGVTLRASRRCKARWGKLVDNRSVMICSGSQHVRMKFQVRTYVGGGDWSKRTFRRYMHKCNKPPKWTRMRGKRRYVRRQFRVCLGVTRYGTGNPGRIACTKWHS